MYLDICKGTERELTYFMRTKFHLTATLLSSNVILRGSPLHSVYGKHRDVHA